MNLVINGDNGEHTALKKWKLSILRTVNKRISFYCQNTNLLPPKPKTSLRHLKLGIQKFHRKYVLAPSLFDGSIILILLSKNLVVQRPMNYNPWLKRGLLVNDHTYHLATGFIVSDKEGQNKLPTLYWLPKLHKIPYKARFMANSSSCATTELSKLLTSCLTAIRKHVINYCNKVYERSGKNLFWSIKKSNEVLNKLKSRYFRASSLSMYDSSTLSHNNLIIL